MTKDDIIRMALDSYGAMTGTGSILFTLNGSLERFAESLEAKIRADERNALLTALEKLRDESHTILGASDDYKQGREMGIQLCINELTRGEK